MRDSGPLRKPTIVVFLVLFLGVVIIVVRGIRVICPFVVVRA